MTTGTQSRVTLIITHVGPRRIFQSGDFRLTHARTGVPVDYLAQKQIFVQRWGWTALVGFCGIAHTGREYVPEWIVQQLQATPDDASFDDFVLRLQSAEDWLAGAIPRFRAITFSVGAFVEYRPTFVLITNFEAIGRPRPVPHEYPADLEVTVSRTEGSGCSFLVGQRRSCGKSAVGSSARCGAGSLRNTPTPHSQRSTFARRAETARLAPLASRRTRPRLVSWAEDRTNGRRTRTTYRHSPIHGLILPRLKTAIDEQGRPKPIQLKGRLGRDVRSLRRVLPYRPRRETLRPIHSDELRELAQGTRLTPRRRSCIPTSDRDRRLICERPRESRDSPR